MNIAVITRHAISNYGSLLQAFATQQAIEALGYSCSIIDYIREDETYYNQEVTLLKRKSQWNKNMLTRAIYLALRQPESIIAGRHFLKQRKKFLKLTKEYHSLNDLQKDPPQADVYLTGSDQVWGPVADGSYDPVYCLAFTNKKKAAYAASFGHAKFAPNVEEYYKKWLGLYNNIAVREDSAVMLLEKMGIPSKQVLDPTLLFNGEFWSQFCEPIKQEKYILVYQLHNNQKLDQYAQKVAARRGLPLVRISASFHQVLRSGKFRFLPTIGQFLSYIKNAECLITDSFHGTAFAINFNTSFVEVLPNTNTATRNQSLLRMTGLENRILTDNNNVDLACQPVNFEVANQILEKERACSFDIFKEILR